MIGEITPEQRLLLSAVLDDQDVAAEAFDRWRATVDTADVDPASQRLTPLLVRRFEGPGAAEVGDRLRGLYRYTWARNRVLWRHSLRVLDAFDDAGIPYLLLKGLALLRAYRGDWGARPMYDVDVLIRPADLDRALTILDQDGWHPELGLTIPWVRSRAVDAGHSVGFEDDDGGVVDLHWHALWASVGTRADDAFWRDAVTVEIDGRSVRVLHPADALLHALVHGTTGDEAPRLQMVADAVLLGRHAHRELGAAALAERLARQARAQGVLAGVITELEVLRTVADDDWITVLLDRLRACRPTAAERMRRRPDPGQPWDRALRYVARYAAGGTPLPSAAAAVVRDRLQVRLTTHPLAAGLYAVTGRPDPLGRVLRGRLGTFVRTASPPTVLDAGSVLDFTELAVMDRYAATGWAGVSAEGATTRGGESRLVLPLAAARAARPLVVTMQLRAWRPDTIVDVRANEERVARVAVDTVATTVTFSIPSAVVRRFSPLEVSLRRPFGLLLPTPLGVVLGRLEVRAVGQSSTPAPASERTSA